MLNRRNFLGLLLGAPVHLQHPAQLPLPADRLVQVRNELQEIVNDRYIALDLRALDEERRELFRIQFNADMLLPVASCFKAFVVPWYFLTVPKMDWDDGPGSPVWEMAVNSRNYFTAVVLDQVARNVPGEGNAIEKFNDFLLSTGLSNGIYLWRAGPTLEDLDRRFQPLRSTGRMVRLGERQIPIFNVFTASDLANGYNFLARGGYYHSGPEVEVALQRARALLGRSERGLLSPIERAYSPGYIGKHGTIPPQGIPTGFVLNDAGLLNIGKLQFIIAFMSVAEFEIDAMAALHEIVHLAILLERELRRAPARDIPRVRG